MVFVNTIRAFIGIRVDQSLADACVQSIDRLQAECKDQSIRWTPIENLHVTLQFLGEINLKQVDQCMSMLTSVAKNTSALTLFWDDVICFPPNRPFAFAVALRPSVSLVFLADQLNRHSQFIGIEPDRHEFLPHITLGRVKTSSSFSAINAIEKITPTPTQRVNSIILFESTLKDGRVVYKALHSQKLS